MKELECHTRQYRHNNSDDFVIGYDLEGVEKVFTQQQEEIKALKAQLELIKLKWQESQGDIQTLFDTQPVNMSDNSAMVDGQSLTELGKAIMGEINQQGDCNGK